MSNGWISIHRQIQECDIWTDDEPFDRRSAWIDLLLSCNHRDKDIIFNGNPMTIKRGQYLTSVRKLAERWHWGKDRVLRYLRLLEQTGKIVRESDSNKTLLTVVKYEFYQDMCDSDKDSDKDSNKDSDKPQTIKKQRNKEINNNKRVYFDDDELLNDAFISYVEHRKNLKSKMSEHAIELAIKKLNELSGGSSVVATQIIEQSIREGWKGLFPLKENSKPKANSFNNFSNTQNYNMDELEKRLLAQ